MPREIGEASFDDMEYPGLSISSKIIKRMGLDASLATDEAQPMAIYESFFKDISPILVLSLIRNFDSSGESWNMRLMRSLLEFGFFDDTPI